MPAHHKAEDYVDAYIEAAGLEDRRKQPLIRSAVGRSRRLSGKRMTRYAALKIIQGRARKAGILSPICCHGFRATGITNDLLNGGTLEKAQRMANQESAKMTKLYNRQDDQVERISI